MNFAELKMFCMLGQLLTFELFFFPLELSVFVVHQGSDTGSAVHSQSARTGHDGWSACSGINGVCFTASRRVSHFWIAAL